jgi:hypothetical protein
MYFTTSPQQPITCTSQLLITDNDNNVNKAAPLGSSQHCQRGNAAQKTSHL